MLLAKAPDFWSSFLTQFRGPGCWPRLIAQVISQGFFAQVIGQVSVLKVVLARRRLNNLTLKVHFRNFFSQK